MTQATIDLIWWIGGGVVAGVGLALLVWALIGDRSRGRKRCPKCWYDMSSTPRREEGEFAGWVCPECGRRVANFRALQRSRRRWKSACVAVILILTSAAATIIYRTPGSELLRYVPTRVLIWLMPQTEWAKNPYARVVGGIRTPPPTPVLGFANDIWVELNRRKAAGQVHDQYSFEIGFRHLESGLTLPATVTSEDSIELQFRNDIWWWSETGRCMEIDPADPRLQSVFVMGFYGQTIGHAGPHESLGRLPAGEYELEFTLILREGRWNHSDLRRFEPSRELWRRKLSRRIRVLAAEN